PCGRWARSRNTAGCARAFPTTRSSNGRAKSWTRRSAAHSSGSGTRSGHEGHPKEPRGRAPMSRAVAGVQFPGVNCEAETVRALERVGLRSEVFGWTRPVGELRDFTAFVLPGGFSYQDRVRAGALAAKDPRVEVLAEQAEMGKPVLGICNGAQVLVEAGLVPGSETIELALARNAMERRSGYHARWVHVRVEASPCLF